MIRPALVLFAALAGFGVLSATSCSSSLDTYHCKENLDCQTEGRSGATCESNTLCSFSAPECLAGQRYSSSSGELSNECVSAVAACGDGNQDSGENCDDGNLVSGDGCSSVCELESLCGNGDLDAGEGCDDGNLVAGDDCSAECTVESLCGNNDVDLGETCDDGNVTPDDGCSAGCIIECGDGDLDGEEGCDDGNVVSDDGCSSTCTVEPFCGDGNRDDGEDCDDGNTVPGDGCSATCTVECGNGLLDLNEGCDDGINDGTDDSCASDCSTGLHSLCDEGWGNTDVDPGPGVCDSTAFPGVSNWMDFETSLKVGPTDPAADLSKGHVDCCDWNVQNTAALVDTLEAQADFDTVDCSAADGRIYADIALDYSTATVMCLRTASGTYLKMHTLADCCGGIQIVWAVTALP